MAYTKVYANMLAFLAAMRLDGEKLRRVAEADSVSDALKMLSEYGFSDAQTIDGFIVEETNALVAFVEEYAVNKSVRDALVAPFFYNNVKLAYKSRFISVPNDGYYAADCDFSSVALGNYDECDDTLRSALEALDEAGEKRPQAIDLALTRAMYKSVLKCGVKKVRDYFRTEIDLKNILTAARLRRLGKTRDEFIDGGKITLAVLDSSVTAEEYSECFAGTPYYDAAKEAEKCEFKELWRIERIADEYLYGLTNRDVDDMASYDPFLKYYIRTQIELKAIKTALVCIKTDSRDVFYLRVPRLFADEALTA